MKKEDIDLKDETPIDDFDFDSGDFDDDFGDLEDGSGSRGASSGLAGRGIGKLSDLVVGGSVTGGLVEGLLPSKFSPVVDDISTVRNGINDTFDEIKTSIKPTLRKTSLLLKKTGLTKNKYLDKLANKLDGDGSDFSYDSGPKKTADQEREEGATSAVDELFASMSQSQAKVSLELDSRNREERKTTDIVKLSKFVRIESLLGKQVGFSQNIQFNYYKQSLKSSFIRNEILKDILKTARTDSSVKAIQLENITKNTSLPEFVKMRGSERFKELIRDRSLGGIEDGVFGDPSNGLGKMLDNIKTGIVGKVKNLSEMTGEIVSGIADGAEASTDVGMSKSEMLGELAISSGRTKLREKSRSIASKYFNKDRISELKNSDNKLNALGGKVLDETGNKLNKALLMRNNTGHEIKNAISKLDDMYYDNPIDGDSKLSSKAKGVLAKGASALLTMGTGTNNNIIKDHDKVMESVVGGGSLGIEEKQSLKVVIPKLLSKIYSSVEGIRTGSVPDELLFDMNKGNFTTTTIRNQKTHEILDRDLNLSGHKKGKDDVLKFASEEGGLSKEALGVLDKFITDTAFSPNNHKYNSAHRGALLTEDKLYKDIDPNITKELKQFGSTLNENNDLDTKYTNLVRYSNNVLGNPTNVITKLINDGQLGELVNMGLVKSKDGVRSIDVDNVNSYILNGGQTNETPTNSKDATSQKIFTNKKPNIERTVDSNVTIPELDYGILREALNGLEVNIKDKESPLNKPITEPVNKTVVMDSVSFNEVGVEQLASNNKALLDDLTNRNKFTSISKDLGVIRKTLENGINVNSIIEKEGKFSLGKGRFKNFSLTSLGDKLIVSSVKRSFSFLTNSILKMRKLNPISMLLGIGKKILFSKGSSDNKKKKSGLFGGGLTGIYSSVLNNSLKLVNSTVGNVFGMLGSPGRFIGNIAKKTMGVLIGTGKRISDVYVSDIGNPVITAIGLKAGIYFDKATGEVIRSLDDIKGEVVDSKGNVLISLQNIKDGLFDRNGSSIKLRTSGIIGYVTGRLRSGGNLIKKTLSTGLKKGAGIVKDIAKKGSDNLGRLYDAILGKSGHGSGIKKTNKSIDKSNTVLNKIFKLLDDRLPKNKKKIAGDFDGDGDRDNGVRDILSRKLNKVKDKKKKTLGTKDKKEKKDSSGFGLGGIITTFMATLGLKFGGLIKSISTGFLGLIGLLKTKALLGDGGGFRKGNKRNKRKGRRRGKGLFGKVTALAGVGYMASDAIGGSGDSVDDGYDDADIIDKETATKKKTVSKIKKPKIKKPSILKKASKSIFKSIGKKVLAGVLIAGAGAATVASAGTAAPLLAGAVGFGLTTWSVYDTVTDVYHGFKYLADANAKPSFLGLRIRQYGLGTNMSDRFKSILALEQLMIKHNTYTISKNVVTFKNNLPMDDIVELFGVNPSDEIAYGDFLKWFKSRFKPVFGKYLMALNLLNIKGSLNKLDLLLMSDRIDILKIVSFKNGPYAVSELPFSSEYASQNYSDVVTYVNELETSLVTQHKKISEAIKRTEKLSKNSYVSIKDGGRLSIKEKQKPKIPTSVISSTGGVNIFPKLVGLAVSGINEYNNVHELGNNFRKSEGTISKHDSEIYKIVSSIDVSNMRTINSIVIHCSASPPSIDLTASDIDQMHKKFNGIGYHYVLRRSGKLETGRSIYKIGAHVKGHNTDSIGICIVGGVDHKKKPEVNYTEYQWQSLESLVKALKELFPNAEVKGHRDFPNVKKACPCFSVSSWWRKVGIGNFVENKLNDVKDTLWEAEPDKKISKVGKSPIKNVKHKAVDYSKGINYNYKKNSKNNSELSNVINVNTGENSVQKTNSVGGVFRDESSKLAKALGAKLTPYDTKDGKRYSSDNNMMNSMIAIESMGRADVVNKFNYAGIGQMGKRAWKDANKKYNNSFGSFEENKLDPDINFEAMKAYMSINAAQLQRRGIPINPTTLYLSHQQGVGGLSQIWRAAKNGTEVSSKIRNNLNNNAGKNKTPMEFLEYWDKKMGTRATALAKLTGNTAMSTPEKMIARINDSIDLSNESKTKETITADSKAAKSGVSKKAIEFSHENVSTVAKTQIAKNKKKEKTSSDYELQDKAYSTSKSLNTPTTSINKANTVVKVDNRNLEKAIMENTNSSKTTNELLTTLIEAVGENGRTVGTLIGNGLNNTSENTRKLLTKTIAENNRKPKNPLKSPMPGNSA